MLIEDGVSMGIACLHYKAHTTSIEHWWLHVVVAGRAQSKNGPHARHHLCILNMNSSVLHQKGIAV